jgi:hypothetical protein
MATECLAIELVVRDRSPKEGESPSSARVRSKFDGVRLRRVPRMGGGPWGRARGLGQDAQREAGVEARGANPTNTHGPAVRPDCPSRESGAGRKGKDGRRRHRDRPVHPMTLPSRRTPTGRTRSRGTCASSETVRSFGSGYTAMPCGLRRRSRASATRRGSRGAPECSMPCPGLSYAGSPCCLKGLRWISRRRADSQ